MKRHPRLRGLSDDHHTALVVAVRCKRASESELAGLWPNLREALRSLLEPHFRIEEQHLLPALDAMGHADLASRIRSDHARLRELGSLEAAELAAVRELGALLEAHTRFEERQVFEPLQDQLPDESLDAIARACEGSVRSCPTGLLAPPPAPTRAESEGQAASREGAVSSRDSEETR